MSSLTKGRGGGKQTGPLFALFPLLITPSKPKRPGLLLSSFRDQKSDEQNFSRTNFPLMRVAGFTHFFFCLLVLLRDFSHLAHAHRDTHTHMRLINNFFLGSRLICALAEFDMRLSVSGKALGLPPPPFSFILIIGRMCHTER